MVEAILIALTAFYAVQITLFALAARNARYPTDSTIRPSVAVIIAARNEEHNLPRCLESIAQLTYPRELLEVVVVDDRSTDRTQDIIREYAGQYPHIRLEVVRETDDPKNRGKANALAQGIEVSRGDILMFTDADCTVPRNWVEATIQYYDTERTGMVAGFVAIRWKTCFEAIQALDWFYLMAVAAATIRLGYVVTAIGNNLSLRRKTYDAAGGYRSIPFSVTEDHALVHAVSSRTSYRARLPLDPDTVVETEACKTWIQLYRQKKRWFLGGRKIRLQTVLLFFISYVFNVMLLLALVAAPSGITLLCVLTKTVVDFALVSIILHSFGRLRLLRHFLPFEIYFTLYVIAFPLLVFLNPTVKWKDRRFS